MIERIVRGPLLVPLDDGSVAWHPDGALAADGDGVLVFAGDWNELRTKASIDSRLVRISDGIILPPLLDIHIHVPQHPIRGGFVDGVPEDIPGGRLLAGLRRNVFPVEAKCSEIECARGVIEDFRADTLAHGVVGGAAYMTVSAGATEAALEMLGPSWSVGLVLMNQNCPENLRTDEPALDIDMARMAERFGRRLIVTDRFAVSVDSPLRRRAVELAKRFGLRTQTHLNEQTGEKRFVESTLYPDIPSYTEVYLRDGLLDHRCILAHCIHTRPEEWKIIRDSGSVIAHCPTSNLLLGSGVMPLDEVIEHRIPYALATDVGASPTVSMLAEMGRFLQVHLGRTARATPSEALWRSTLGPAQILGLEDQFGRLEAARPVSFIEVQPDSTAAANSADDAIRSVLPKNLDHPAPVNRVTVAGEILFEKRGLAHA
jgi:guanine deaminase